MPEGVCQGGTCAFRERLSVCAGADDWGYECTVGWVCVGGGEGGVELGKRGEVVSQAGSAAEGEERVEILVYLP